MCVCASCVRMRQACEKANNFLRIVLRILGREGGEFCAPFLWSILHTIFCVADFLRCGFFDGLRRLDFEPLRKDSRNGSQCCV